MELGSESASCLASSQDHHVLPPSNGGHLDGSFEHMNSSSCNGALPAAVSVEGEELISEGPLFVDRLCTESHSKEVISVRLEDVTQGALENSAIDGEKAAEAHKRCDHGLGTDLGMIGSREHVKGWSNEMDAGEQVPRWMAAEKLSSVANVPESSRSTESLAANHSVPEKSLPASRRRTFFMIRMPRTADSELRSKIRLAELQLEEASKTRDVIRAALQLKRASKIGLLDKLKVVRDKERACKEEFQKKRLEIDPFQTALNRLKLADTKYKEDEIFSEDDLDNKIARLQHRIQHESIPLKEEKQLIREIKQLESQRSQVCANDAEHAHLLENFGPKEDIQEQLDVLYRELDVLRTNQNQAWLECKPIEKDLEDLNVKIDELVDQLEAAKRSQAAALTVCKELKRSLSEQNAEFYKYRDAFKKAKQLASSKNLEDLAVLCNEQVESMLRCWNSDPSFRERYIKNNVNSTLRRLETLDGRSLGLDEEPLLLMSDMEFATETRPKDINYGSKQVGLQKEVNVKNPISSAQGNHVKEVKGDEGQQPQDTILKKSSSSVSQKKEVTESKKSKGNLAQSSINTSPLSFIATTPPMSIAPAPVEDAAVKEAQAAELKEKRRQEEMAKAREAAERKRRQAERAQAKAQLREQKEAERREKERAKKSRRKVAVGIDNLKTVETPAAIDSKEKSLRTEDLPKDLVKGSSSEGTSFLAKQPKSQRHPVLSPLSRKKLWHLPSTWLWVSLVIIVIGLALIFVVRS